MSLTARPERIVSLVPSQTELLIDLGAGDRVVGRTRYCIHPEARVSGIEVVGGTKRMDRERIRSLRPDFFLAEKEETPKEWVEALSELAPVYVTDVVSIPSAISMIESVGEIIGSPSEAGRLAARIRAELEGAKSLVAGAERALYLIWKKPWMAAGADTFIHSCLEHLGFRNALSAAAIPGRYPELAEAAIRDLAPDRIFLSSEPYPFRERHLEELREISPAARIELVDGELFSWYGSRMLEMPPYWRRIFGPGA